MMKRFQTLLSNLYLRRYIKGMRMTNVEVNARLAAACWTPIDMADLKYVGPARYWSPRLSSNAF